MIEKAYIELMHKEIDGAIDPEEKDRLSAYLKSNDEAAQYYQDLLQTANLLNQVPEVNTPKNIKTRILSSLDWRLYSSPKKIFSQNSFSSNWLFKPGYKLAYSFALGVMVGILIFALALPFMNSNGTLDTNDLYGTIGLDAEKGVKELQHIPIQLEEINGNIYLRKFNEFIILDIELKSQLNSQLWLGYEPSDYQFRGIQQNRSNRIQFEEGNSFIRASNPKDAMYQVYFSRSNSKLAPFDLKISVSDRILLHQSIFVNIN